MDVKQQNQQIIDQVMALLKTITIEESQHEQGYIFAWGQNDNESQKSTNTALIAGCPDCITSHLLFEMLKADPLFRAPLVKALTDYAKYEADKKLRPGREQMN